MSHSLAQIYLHLVFSTKHRQPFLLEHRIRSRMHAYLGGICKEKNCSALEIGGVEDHVHLLCQLARTVSVADLIRDLKRASSLWLKKEESALSSFDWQSGYGAFSVGHGELETVRHYIARQEEHHHQERFPDEFLRMLREANIPYNEQYLWD